MNLVTSNDVAGRARPVHGEAFSGIPVADYLPSPVRWVVKDSGA